MEIKKYKNLLSQSFTQKGKLNFYVVDNYEDLEKIPQDEIEIIGCRAYVIGNGKFYVMDSNKVWHEQDFIYDISFDEKITRRGVYTFNFDPQIHDGIQTLKITVEPTLQPFEETFTRSGEYERKYNRTNFDGFDDLKINFQPTLQSLEEEITESGEYEFAYDKENYDGLDTVKVNVDIIGGGNGLVAVDSLDDNPDFLENKLVTKEGSGIQLITNTETNQLEIFYHPAAFEIDFVETMPFASIQSEAVPTYQQGAATLIATSVVPNYNFSFDVGRSLISFYSSTGEMTNCRLLVLRVNDDNSATVIAYTRTFNVSANRSNNKVSAICEYAGEKIKAGKRYYIGLIGTLSSTEWINMFGYSHWGASEMTFVPPFNIYSNYSININNPLVTIPRNQLIDNNAFYVYFDLER